MTYLHGKRSHILWSWLAVITLIGGLAQACGAQTTTLISVTNGNVQGNGDSYFTGVSGDGRYVAFSSFADNLITGGTNGWLQVLRHDANDGSIIDTSLDINGDEAIIYSWFPTISADGNRVGFTSNSYNLVTLGSDFTFQAYVRDVSSGVTLLASSDSTGIPGNDESYFSAISGNGRYMAFASFSDNLVPNDNNGVDDVFRKDLQTGAIIRVSVGPSGVQGNGSSGAPQISNDGRYVIFSSDATSLVANDTNGKTDIFVRDCVSGVTERLSVSSSGVQSNGGSDWPSISWDGRYAAFESIATNLVTPNTAAGRSNVYIRDRVTGSTVIESVSTAGVYGNAGSSGAVISGNGKYICFNSDATNLTTDTLHSQTNVFVRKLATGQTSLVSKSTTGIAGNGNSDWSTISGDGRVISYASYSTNLISAGTDGTRQIYTYEQAPPFATIRLVNCAGPAVGGWTADASYAGGMAFYVMKTISNVGTTPQGVYQTARTGRFDYNFTNLPNGTYQVILYFEEPAYSRSGQRVFNVSAEGKVALSNFDVFAAAGGAFKAVKRSFTVSVTDSNGLKLSFTPTKLDAIVCGIEIQKSFE